MKKLLKENIDNIIRSYEVIVKDSPRIMRHVWYSVKCNLPMDSDKLHADCQAALKWVDCKEKEMIVIDPSDTTEQINAKRLEFLNHLKTILNDVTNN